MGMEDDKKLYRDMYMNKHILAPMVRIGTLPTRLLALRYGADLVYSEEIIDFKMLRTSRIENKLLKTIDFVMADGTVVFRTCDEEHDKVVFQMCDKSDSDWLILTRSACVRSLGLVYIRPVIQEGPIKGGGTSDPERALKTAKHVEQDVAAVDVNMGCPKDYSTKGGMGAALLTNPDKIYQILTTLVKGVYKPVTCKIRILPTIEETLKLARLIESTGVTALAVHGREKHERSREPAHNDVLRAIAGSLTIPVIANGGSLDIKTFEDMEKYKYQTNCTSVMVARAAQWNLSIFRKDGPLSKLEMIKEYIKAAIDYDNFFSNSKFCIITLLHEENATELARKITAAKDMEELCAAVDFLPYYKECQKRRSEQKLALSKENSKPTVVKRKLSETELYEVLEMKVKFLRSHYSDFSSPKGILTEVTRKRNLQPPVYKTVMDEETRTFRSTVTVDNKIYSSSEWEKSKKHAEQAAAIVCLRVLGIHDGRIKETDESLT